MGIKLKDFFISVLIVIFFNFSLNYFLNKYFYEKQNSNNRIKLKVNQNRFRIIEVDGKEYLVYNNGGIIDITKRSNSNVLVER